MSEKYKKHFAKLGARESVKKYFPKYYDVIFSPKRSGGLALLDFKKDEIVVDAGCMWGALTVPLARKQCRVVAIDQTEDSLALLKQRLADEDLNNVSLVCGNLKKIRFKKNSVDKVIVNGVLEWIPEEGKIELGKWWGKRIKRKNKNKKSPISKQKEFLKEIYRGLKTDGKLFLAIENRFDIFNFFGDVDPHMGMRFITIMPRKIQDMMSLMFRGSRYLNWTYSPKEFKNILREIGFTNIEIYAVFPNYREPEIIFPLEGKSYSKANFHPISHLNKKSFFKKVRRYLIEYVTFKKLKLFKFSPCLIAVANKNCRSIEIIRNCLHYGTVQTGFINDKNSGQKLIIKNSFYSDGAKVIEREFNGICWYADRLGRKRNEFIYKYENNIKTAVLEMVFSEGKYGDIRLELRKNINKLNNAVCYYNNVLNMINSEYSHGDYTLENILFNKKDEVVRIVDWEHFNNDLPKEFDLLNCVLENCIFIYRRSPKLLKEDIDIAKTLLLKVAKLAGIPYIKFKKPASYFRDLCLKYKRVFDTQIMKYPFVICSLKDIEVLDSFFN